MHTNFKNFINESNDSTEDKDKSEYEMVISELNEVHKFSKMIIDIMESDEDIPAWIQSQIAVAANDMNSIYQYLEGKELAEDLRKED